MRLLGFYKHDCISERQHLSQIVHLNHTPGNLMFESVILDLPDNYQYFKSKPVPRWGLQQNALLLIGLARGNQVLQ